MSYANPIWLEGRRKYWTRPDAYRFAPSGSPQAKMPGWLDPWATRVRAKEAAEEASRAQAEAAHEAFERELLQLRCEVKKLKLEHELWCFEQKYSANQPRVPTGNPDGGQWMSGGEQSSTSNSFSDPFPEPIRPGTRQVNVIRICIVGSRMITTDRFGNQSWWADYVCADGFTFRRFGTGDQVPGFSRDRR